MQGAGDSTGMAEGGKKQIQKYKKKKTKLKKQRTSQKNKKNIKLIHFL